MVVHGCPPQRMSKRMSKPGGGRREPRAASLGSGRLVRDHLPMDAKASDNPNDPSQIRAPRERVPGYGPAEDDRSSDAGLPDDVIAAVHTQFGEKDAAQVLGW